MGPNGLTTLISDLGGVLVGVDMRGFNRELARRAGCAPDEVWARIEAEGSWRDYETGALDTAAFAAILAALLRIDLDTETFARLWNDVFPGEHEGVGALYRRVKDAGLALVALSNTNVEHAAAFPRFTPSFHLFDAAYYSHEIGARKPDAAAYRHVLDARALAPSQCLFVDDRPENIAAAEALGLRGILAEGTPSIERGLCDAGVLP